MQVDLDKFRFMVVRALRYYETMLIGLANNVEGERIEAIADPFGYYLDATAKQAGTYANELRHKPSEITTLVKQDRYRTIVREALAFYIADLKKRQEIILGEELAEGNKHISSHYESEIDTAENLKQWINEAAAGDNNTRR
jgi:hypothetical protein